MIVVDDASTDESREVIERFADSITAVFHDTNLGQGAAINSGAAQANGELVWFLDADDALLPEACETAARAFELDRRFAKFHTPLAIIDGEGSWGGELLPADPERLAVGDIGNHIFEFRAHGWPPMSGNAYAMDALVRVLPIPAEDYRQAADSFLNEQIAICGTLARSDEPVAAYREHGGNQFAGTEVDLGWLRTKIHRELCSHERLGMVAWQLGLNGYQTNPAEVRDVSFFGYRLASLRLDPIGHPIVDPSRPDGRFRLAADGIRAALTNPQLAQSDRLIRCAWFAATAAVPKVLVRSLLAWYLPDGPSQPIWRRRRRARQQSTARTELVPSASEKDENGGTSTNR